MNILVTGATGYIGSHTVVELVRSGYNVIGLDNFINSNRKTIESIKQISGSDFKFYTVDMTDYYKLKDVFNQNEIDVVIHFAALKSVSESVINPLNYYHNNITGTLNLLKCMSEKKIKKLIFSSSATVYGNSGAVPYSEDNILSATNPYGRTKLYNEQILNDYSQAEKDVKIIILRYFNPIGAHKSGLLADRPNGLPSNIMPLICSVATGKQSVFEVFGNDYETPDGSCVRDYIHVCDVADGHIKIMEHIDKIDGIKVYNLGRGKPISVFELIQIFEKVTRLKIPYKIINRRSGDVAVSYADISRVFSVLGWTAKKTIEEMCLDSYRSVTLQ